MRPTGAEGVLCCDACWPARPRRLRAAAGDAASSWLPLGRCWWRGRRHGCHEGKGRQDQGGRRPHLLSSTPSWLRPARAGASAARTAWRAQGRDDETDNVRVRSFLRTGGAAPAAQHVDSGINFGPRESGLYLSCRSIIILYTTHNALHLYTTMRCSEHRHDATATLCESLVIVAMARHAMGTPSGPRALRNAELYHAE